MQDRAHEAVGEFDHVVRVGMVQLASALPDLALLVRRDGTLLAHLGGRNVKGLIPPVGSEGCTLEAFWPAQPAAEVRQLVRRAIASRTTLDLELTHVHRYEVQATPQAPDRAICVIRRAMSLMADDSCSPASQSIAHLERRGFLRRFEKSLSAAALHERALAVAMIVLDGIVDIARVLDSKIAEQVISTAAGRLQGAIADDPPWYLGQFSENLYVVVVEATRRELIERCVENVCTAFREPIQLRDSMLYLTPHAGVAVFGRDATSPRALLERARSAATEARRSGNGSTTFFTNTLELRSLARLDAMHELRNAIDNGNVRLRYAGRHELATGRLTAAVGYMKWLDAMRGDIRPSEFLALADASGLAIAVSQSVLAQLPRDFEKLASLLPPDGRLSFGALRQHVLHESFVRDVKQMLARGPLGPDRLELRISERAYLSCEAHVWHDIADMGVQIVIDELARNVSSLDLLARVPLWGLQLDRSWTTPASRDLVAKRVCGALINVASSLGLVPIATGVDNIEQRSLLADLGCSQGSGDLYGDVCPMLDLPTVV